MEKSVRSILLRKLVANPDNPNQMSKTNLLKLARSIGKTGFYEPLIVQPYKQKKEHFQIINGYHRVKILMKLGYKTVDCIVWNVDSLQTRIFLATLNRLGGKDNFSKRINLVKSLAKELKPAELSKYLLLTKTQIIRLLDFQIKNGKASKSAKHLLNTMIFFVTDVQKEKIEKALLSLSEQVKDEKSKAAKNAAALTVLAEFYLDHISK